jgi:heme a synthase
MSTRVINLSKQDKFLISWLMTCIILVLITLIIGGLTRLENAGLSIVDWRPVTGIIPPLHQQDWLTEFAKYQTSPEYNLINKHIDLKEFKYIYFLEYIHRVAGRLVGIIFALPYFYMLIKRSISVNKLIKLGIVLSLIGFQGFMGWFMVSSGLINNPHVSHFRLAAHLVTALIIYSLMFMLILEIYFKDTNFKSKNLNSSSIAALFMVILIFCQITLGAFVAGLDAGMIYNQFPQMGNSFIPYETKQIGFNIKLLSDPASIQFIHRCFAYILVIYIFLFYLFTKNISSKLFRVACQILLSIVAIQFVIGIAVVLLIVPTYLALIHQIFAVFLITCSLYIYFVLRWRS